MLKSKARKEIKPPFDLNVTQEIKMMHQEIEQHYQKKPSEKTDKSPTVHEKAHEKPNSLVLRVKRRQQRNKIYLDCQYEIVHRKTEKKNVDNADQKEQTETEEGEKENTSEQKQEEQNEGSDYEEETETKIDEQVNTVENEVIIDVDEYFPSSKAYKSKDLTKSSILQLLNEEQ